MNEGTKMRLGDVFTRQITGEWGEECDDPNSGVKVLRTTNFTNDGIVDYSNVVVRKISERKIAEKCLLPGDIILEKSGGSDNQPVGRVVFFNDETEVYLCNNFTQVIRPDRSIVVPRFILYFMWHMHRNGVTESFQNKTTGIRNLQVKRYMDLEVHIPTLSKQEKIVSMLDAVSQILRLRKAQLAELDNLVKSQFIEMFGNSDASISKWEIRPLSDLANIVSGVTKGRKNGDKKLYDVPYMSVANVKDGYIDWTTVKSILATEEEIDRYRLYDDDVLMTEGGDPDKVGRGSLLKNPPPNCIHQNHIFRVRLNQQRVLARFFAEYLMNPAVKRYFLGCAKQTTGIASINMKQLRALPVIQPPIEVQECFVSISEQVDKSKFAIQQSLDETQRLFDSLMAEYFEE